MTPCGDDRLPLALAAQTKAAPQLRPLRVRIPCPRPPPSLQFGKQIDILNKRKQKFSSQTTLPLWDGGGAKSAPGIASRATDVGRGLGPETRASGGGRRHGSAQPWPRVPALSPQRARAERCRSPRGGGGRSLPAASRRATALQLRRVCKRACVHACVCARVCARSRAPVCQALRSPRPFPFRRRPSLSPQRARPHVPAALTEFAR